MIDQVIEGPLVRARAEMSDDTLITLFQSGEEFVYQYLVERYRERVRNLIFSILNAPNLIDDLAQEVFIKAYEGLPRFRFDSSFYTWLYRITVNRCRDEMRKRKLRKFFSLHAANTLTDRTFIERTSQQPHDYELSEWITKGLQNVPDKFRLPIILKDIDGRTYEEMAVIMQCEMGTVKSRLSRGRAMLREYLSPLLEVN